MQTQRCRPGRRHPHPTARRPAGLLGGAFVCFCLFSGWAPAAVAEATCDEPATPCATKVPSPQAPRAVDGRADLWAARRADKLARQRADAEPASMGTLGSLAASVFAHVRHADQPSDGLALVFGGRESGHGLQGGVRYTFAGLGRPLAGRAMPNRMDLSVEALGSLGGYTKTGARLTTSNLAGSSFNVAVIGSREWRRDEGFYGLGPDAAVENASLFSLDNSRAGAELWWSDDDERVAAGGGIDLLDYTQAALEPDATASGAPLVRPLDLASIPGATSEVRLLRWRGFVRLDGRDLPVYPRDGGYLAAGVSLYDDIDATAHEFHTIDVEAARYFPFLHKRRVIALRFVGEFARSGEGTTIPFYLQPSLGGPDDMRGLPTFRYRGHNKLLLQAEYRWEAWVGLDMAVFVDTGQVYDRREQLGFDALETTYGLGLRFKKQESSIIRVDFAHGDEGLRSHVSFNRIF